MKTHHLLILFACFITESIFAITTAKEGKIFGKIIVSDTKKIIDFADVLLFIDEDTQPIMQTIPNQEGVFTFDALPPQTYSLQIRSLGYEPYTKKDLLINENNKTLDLETITLKQLEVGLAEVVVVTQKRQLIYKLDKRIIDASTNMLAAGGTAVDILENTPSIRVNAEGEVTFRGSAGFNVYVDGKPSIFSGTQALEQIPSSQIANIEIITTPSAKYDAKGDVGIINVITKKQTKAGLSAIVNISGSTALSNGIDFLLTQNKGKSRWYIGGNYSNQLRESDFDQRKTTIVNDTTSTSHSKGPRSSNNYNYTGKIGWEYSLPNTNLGVEFGAGYVGRKRAGNLDYTDTRLAGKDIITENTFNSEDNYDLHEIFEQGIINFNHKFNDKGHALSGRFYLKYGGDALEYFQSDLINKQNEREQGHRAWEEEHRWSVRGNLDYTLPYSETGRIEAGYQYDSYLEDGEYSMQFWNPISKEFYWRDDIYNTFYFQRGVNSLYVLLAESYKKFEFQVGARAEHTHQVLCSSVKGSDRTVNRFDFYPSAHIAYNLPNEHRIMASYSRRITQPRLFFMEPYITYRDYYSAEIGNPDIRPEYINSFELNYKKYVGENLFMATLFHRSRTDKIERLRVPYQTSGVTLDSMANVGSDYSTGIEVSSAIKATRWWNININGSLYHYKLDNNSTFHGNKASSTNYEISWNNGFDVGKYTRIQFDGNFIGPSVTTQGGTNAFWFANLAVRQQLFKRKLTGTLAFRDVFGSARYTSHITQSNLHSVTRIKPNYPVITLSLSYTFNNFINKSTGAKENFDVFEGTNH
jgi:outer membrane receptor protein involved in Fe transport